MLDVLIGCDKCLKAALRCAKEFAILKPGPLHFESSTYFVPHELSAQRRRRALIEKYFHSILRCNQAAFGMLEHFFDLLASDAWRPFKELGEARVEKNRDKSRRCALCRRDGVSR